MEVVANIGLVALQPIVIATVDDQDDVHHLGETSVTSMAMPINEGFTVAFLFVEPFGNFRPSNLEASNQETVELEVAHDVGSNAGF